MASVASNTADTLTLWGESNGGAPGDMPAWTNPLGESADTPANGSTYIIYGESGIVEVLDNHIDCSDDGYGGGSYGIKVGSFRSGQRSRVRGNNIKNAGTAAIRVQFVDAARKQLHLEITDNVAWDDQLTPTCTTVLSFSGTPAYDKLILRGNTGDAAMTHVSGLTTGTWLIADGAVSQWAGFGSPESVVVAAIGSSTYGSTVRRAQRCTSRRPRARSPRDGTSKRPTSNSPP